MNNEKTEKLWTIPYIVIILINALSFLNFNMTTSGMPIFAAEIEKNNFPIGLVTTVSAVAALVCRPFSGYLVGKYNSLMIALTGLFMMATAPFVLCFVKSIFVVYISRLIQGIGWGLTSTSCSNIIAINSPKKRLSEGIGYAGAMSSIATAVAPGIAVYFFERIGINEMLIIISLSALISLFLISVLCKEQNNSFNTDRSLKFRITECFEYDAFLPAVLVFIITLCYSPMVTFITQYSMSIGLKNIYLYFFSYALATIITRSLSGAYINRFGYFIFGLISIVSIFVSLILLLFLKNMITLCFSGCMAGIGTGMGINTLQTMAIAKARIQNKGKAIATFLFGFDLGMAVGAVIAGILVEKIDFRFMYGTFSVIALIGILLYIAFYINNRNYFLK